MPLSRLELISSYGDQTIARVQYVAYAAAHTTEAVSAFDAGLSFVEGQPIVSTNLIYAHDLVKQVQVRSLGEPGQVLLFAVPSNLHVGYGIFTSAYIDMALKRVSGSPVRYAGGRKQLALYASPDTEKERVHVEAEVANGYVIEQRPHYLLEPKYLIGTFSLSNTFEVVISQLNVAVRSFEPVIFEKFEASFKEVLRVNDPSNSSLVPTALHEIVVGTIESAVISRLRMVRWQGLALLGYRFIEGQHQTNIPTGKDMAEHKKEMDNLGRLLASSALFAGELNWLKEYAASELDKMRVELEGAELTSLPD
jgi:hypothetical protein